MRERASMDFATIRLFCFGFGYVAQHLARPFIQGGGQIAGTKRSPSNHTIMWDGKSALPEPAVNLLEQCNALLISIPPSPEEGDIALAKLSKWLKTHAAQFQWVGYFSTTGVYGDHEGAWVDETMTPTPHDARTRARAEAEEAWLSLFRQAGLPVHIFRLAGIYGPERNALLQLKSGKARCIHKEGQVFSRIHVEDIVQAVLASLQNPTPGEIYNLADDLPASSHDVLSHASGLTGIPIPECVAWNRADLSPMAASFYAANRRVSNAKIKDKLGVKWRYPTYREGLEALARSEE